MISFLSPNRTHRVGEVPLYRCDLRALVQPIRGTYISVTPLPLMALMRIFASHLRHPSSMALVVPSHSLRLIGEI
jgi:hypothetical protein